MNTQVRGQRQARTVAERIRQLGGHGRWAVPLVVFLALLWVADAAPAEVELDAEVGFTGFLVPGVWTPLRVDVAAKTSLDGVLEIDVQESRGPGASYRYAFRLIGGTRQQIHADIVVSDPRHPLLLRLLRDNREVARRVVPLGGAQAVDGVVAALTHEASGLEFLSSWPTRLRPAYIREDSLPVRWQGYEGVTVLVIRDLDEHRLLAVQRDALRDWIAQGGRLLVTGGHLLANLRSPWLVQLLPAVPVGVSQVPASKLFPGVEAPLNIAVVNPRPGVTVQPDRTLPLVLQGRYGRGVVTLWAFDAFAPPVRNWSGRIALWRDILTRTPSAPIASRTLAESVPSTQPLRGGVQVGIALLLVFYILTVRWSLRRLASVRRGWMGVAAVLAACAALLYGAAVSARGAATSILQVSLVEAVPEAALARVTTYASLIAPYGGPFHLRAPAGATIRRLSGSAMNVFGAPVEIADYAPPEGIKFELMQIVPMPVRGTAVVTREGLQVEIVNGSGLTIREPVIYLDGQIYRLPEIAAHLTASLDPTKWEAFDRRGGVVEGLAHRVRQSTFARLGTDVIIKRDQPSLVGWVDDARLVVRLGGAQEGRAVQLLVVPLVLR